MMRAWQVYERAVPVGRDPDVVIVKDGICWPALFVPVLWGLYRGQWLFVLALVGVALLVAGIGTVAGVDPTVDAALAVLLNVAAALFANDWRAWRLEADGYRLQAVIGARSHDLAERRWFTEFAHLPQPTARPRNPWLPLLGET